MEKDNVKGSSCFSYISSLFGPVWLSPYAEWQGMCLVSGVCEQCFGSRLLPLAWVALSVAWSRVYVVQCPCVCAGWGACVMVYFGVWGEEESLH